MHQRKGHKHVAHYSAATARLSHGGTNQYADSYNLGPVFMHR